MFIHKPGQGQGLLTYLRALMGENGATSMALRAHAGYPQSPKKHELTDGSRDTHAEIRPLISERCDRACYNKSGQSVAASRLYRKSP